MHASGLALDPIYWKPDVDRGSVPPELAKLLWIDVTYAWREPRAIPRAAYDAAKASDLGYAAGAGDVGLSDIERTALEQILEVEPRELALPRGDRECAVNVE